MQEMLLDLWQEFHMTVVFVSHDVDEALFLSDRVLVSSRRPGRIKGALSVDLPRPRDSELLTSPEFMRLKRQALELLGAAVHGQRSGTRALGSAARGASDARLALSPGR
jgi:NitT/TauT family transport system ATP-binding protein